MDLNAEGKDIVVAYCCSCKNRLRTVGCCSHVMVVIWYTLFIEKDKLHLPSSNFDSIFDKHFDTNSETEFELDGTSDENESEMESETE